MKKSCLLIVKAVMLDAAVMVSAWKYCNGKERKRARLERERLGRERSERVIGKSAIRESDWRGQLKRERLERAIRESD
jgi:membrane protein involved in colicin uptake